MNYDGMRMMGAGSVNYGVHDVGSVEAMLPATEPGWLVVMGDGTTGVVVGWAVTVVERSGWVVRTRVAPVAVDDVSGRLVVVGEGYRIVRPGSK